MESEQRFGSELGGISWRPWGHPSGRYAASFSGSTFIGLKRESSQVLGGGREEKFVIGSFRTPEAQAREGFGLLLTGRAKEEWRKGDWGRGQFDLPPTIATNSFRCPIASQRIERLTGAYLARTDR